MIDAVILAGGEGRRMGGQDKGLVDLAGKPLVSWMIAALEAQTHAVDHIMISANRNQPAYAQMGFAVLGDSGTPAGPLAGIYTALQNTQADYLLVVPCDMPLLPADTLARLWQAMQSHQAELTYAHSGNEPAHSVVCLMRRSVCEGLAKRLANQELRLGAWYMALQAVPVDFPAGCLGNFNTAAELAALAAQLSEPSMAMDVTGELTHFNAQGEAHMVNVGAKNETQRIALAEGEISMQPATMSKIDAGASKGDVLGVARVAAIMASKKTADLIPLCHPLPLTRIEVEFIVDRARNTVRCRVTSETVGRTGVEMEALTAVSVGLLTIYDMLKAIDRSMTISGIRLLEKQGGKSGHWRAEDTIRL